MECTLAFIVDFSVECSGQEEPLDNDSTVMVQCEVGVAQCQ